MIPSRGEETDLDRWIRSRLAATVERVTERMQHYDTTFAGRAIAEFVDDLSNWYVRLSRRRFWDGDEVAFETLNHYLVTLAKLLAPFTPFIADEIYENLDGGEPSVHLCDFPCPVSETNSSNGRCRWCATRSTGTGGAWSRQDQGAPAATGGGRRGGGPRAGGD